MRPFTLSNMQFVDAPDVQLWSLLAGERTPPLSLIWYGGLWAALIFYMSSAIPRWKMSIRTTTYACFKSKIHPFHFSMPVLSTTSMSWSRRWDLRAELCAGAVQYSKLAQLIIFSRRWAIKKYLPSMAFGAMNRYVEA